MENFPFSWMASSFTQDTKEREKNCSECGRKERLEQAMWKLLLKMSPITMPRVFFLTFVLQHFDGTRMPFFVWTLMKMFQSAAFTVAFLAAAAAATMKNGIIILCCGHGINFVPLSSLSPFFNYCANLHRIRAKQNARAFSCEQCMKRGNIVTMNINKMMYF